MEQMPHILVVDDDREIRDLLAKFLGRHGFRVSVAGDGRSMRETMRNGRFDMVVLDLMLPGEDGLTLCRELRSGSDIPVIMLTAMGEEIDRIVGLEIGADDYLAKPFNPRELLARIRAVLRRSVSSGPAAPDQPGAIRFDGWRLDPLGRTLVGPEGNEIELTAGEFDLLMALASRPHRLLSRDQLLDLTRGRDALPFDRSIDVQISRLRRKIEPDPARPRFIKTIRSGGYMFTADVDR